MKPFFQTNIRKGPSQRLLKDGLKELKDGL